MEEHYRITVWYPGIPKEDRAHREVDAPDIIAAIRAVLDSLPPGSVCTAASVHHRQPTIGRS